MKKYVREDFDLRSEDHSCLAQNFPEILHRPSLRPSEASRTRLPVSLGKTDLHGGSSRSLAELGFLYSSKESARREAGGQPPQERMNRRCRKASLSCRLARSTSRARFRILKNSALIGVAFIFFCWLMPSGYAAEDKQWTGQGDKLTWEDDANWSPESSPTDADAVSIQKDKADVSIKQTFKASSLTVGGSNPAHLSVDSFVGGTIQPDVPTDTAVLNARDGMITFKGPGVVKVRGQYVDSEGSLAKEPCFMLTVG